MIRRPRGYSCDQLVEEFVHLHGPGPENSYVPSSVCNHYLDCKDCVIHFPDCSQCILACQIQGLQHNHPPQSAFEMSEQIREVDECSSWPLKHTCKKKKSRLGTQLQVKTKSQLQDLSQFYMAYRDLIPAKVKALAKRLGLSYVKVYKWIWDQNERVRKQRDAQRDGLGIIFYSEKIFNITKISKS